MTTGDVVWTETLETGGEAPKVQSNEVYYNSFLLSNVTHPDRTHREQKNPVLDKTGLG